MLYTFEDKEPVIAKNAFIGMNATILHGAEIGELEIPRKIMKN